MVRPGNSSKHILKSKNNRLLLSCIILLSIAAVYGQAAGFDFFQVDDTVYITENPHLQQGFNIRNITWALTTTRGATWQPMVWLSYLLDYQIAGLSAGWYHFVNIVLHALNALLLFSVFRRYTGSFYRSAFVALLFAVHPLHVESVVWIAERKDVLSTFWGLLGIYFYGSYFHSRKKYRYILVAVCFFLSLTAKPMFITLPFVLLLLDYWPLHRMGAGPAGLARKAGRLVFEKLPLFFITVIMSVVFFMVHKHSGDVVPANAWPAGQRIMNAVIAYVQYIQKFFWPFELSVLYPRGGEITWARFIPSALLLLAASALVVRYWRRWPWLFVGWAWFLGTFIPVIGIVQIGNHAMADRFTYLPFIGLYLILAWGIPNLAGYGAGVQKTAWIAGGWGVLHLILVLTAWNQTRYWHSSETLLRHSLAVTHDNYGAHFYLARHLSAIGAQAEAFKHMETALRLEPDFFEAHAKYGLMLSETGRGDAAVPHYLKALSGMPEDAMTLNNLGVELEKKGRSAKALSLFKKAIAADPGYVDPYINIGNLLTRQGKPDESVAWFEKALAIDARSAKAYYNMGVAFQTRAEQEQAIRCFRQVIALESDHAEAHNNLGAEYFVQGRIEKAIFHFRKAIKAKPAFADARDNLSRALAFREQIDQKINDISSKLADSENRDQLFYKLGQLFEKKGSLKNAATSFEQSLQVNAGYIPALNALARLRSREGRLVQAIALYKKMRILEPENSTIYYNLACLHARQGQKAAAVRLLEKAIQKGYDNWELIRNDPDLESIQKTEAYRNILRKHQASN